jgi:nitronate monooxygenase
MANQTTLPFPMQNTMTASLRQLALKTNNGEYQSLWAGEAYSKVRQMRADELMKTLGSELTLAI